MSTLQRTNGKYLWWSLVGLGFQPEVAASSGASKANVKHIILGPYVLIVVVTANVNS